MLWVYNDLKKNEFFLLITEVSEGHSMNTEICFTECCARKVQGMEKVLN